MKSLLVCPRCEENGKKQTLGELDSEGNLIIMRFKGQGERSTTKVISNSMEILCGVCNEVVFYRKSK